MNLWFRLIFVVIHGLFRTKLKPLESSVVRGYVMPTDLDLNFHMNNGRYLSVMDLGRIDILLRTGTARLALQYRWAPLVGAVMIKFRQSLKPFQSYDMVTRVLCWDQKWFYFEHRIQRKNRLIAVAYARTLVRGPGRNIPPSEVISLLGEKLESPPIPQMIQNWAE